MIELIMPAACAELNGGETTRPIVGVNNVGLPIEMFEECEGRAGEKRKAFVVVSKAVDRTTREVLWRLDQVSRRSCSVALHHSCGTNAAAPVNRNICDYFVAYQT